MILKRLTKLFACLLAFAVLLSFAGCNSSDVSSDSSDVSDAFSDAASGCVSHDIDLELEGAKNDIVRLVESDIEITALLLGGGLSKDRLEDYEYRPLDKSSPYYDFSKVEALIDSVYSSSSNVKDRYLSYPTKASPIFKNKDGVTQVCYAYYPHEIPTVDISSLTLKKADGGKIDVCVLSPSGKEYIYKAVLQNNAWRLENSLFFSSLDESLKPSDIKAENGRNEGSAKTLTDKCFILNVFIDDKTSKWTDTKIDRVLHFLDDTARFINDEATLYGVELDLDISDKSTSAYLTTNKTVPETIDEFCWVELLFSSTSYGTLENFAKTYIDTDKYDNWGVMLHIAKNGRSYALKCNSSYSDYKVYYAERTVMFYSDDTSYEYYTVAGAYAHEMLHIFGADDLYKGYISAENETVIDHFFPNAIMRVIYNDLGLQGISPYTAYCIGWLDTIPAPFDIISIK